MPAVDAKIFSIPPARRAIARPLRTAVSFFLCMLSGVFLPSRWSIHPSFELATTHDFFIMILSSGSVIRTLEPGGGSTSRSEP